MKEHKEELTQKQMENIAGGYTEIAHCRVCRVAMVSFGALFRCPTPRCPECGKNKTAAEVDWK